MPSTSYLYIGTYMYKNNLWYLYLQKVRLFIQSNFYKLKKKRIVLKLLFHTIFVSNIFCLLFYYTECLRIWRGYLNSTQVGREKSISRYILTVIFIATIMQRNTVEYLWFHQQFRVCLCVVFVPSPFFTFIVEVINLIRFE